MMRDGRCFSLLSENEDGSNQIKVTKDNNSFFVWRWWNRTVAKTMNYSSTKLQESYIIKDTDTNYTYCSEGGAKASFQPINVILSLIKLGLLFVADNALILFRRSTWSLDLLAEQNTLAKEAHFRVRRELRINHVWIMRWRLIRPLTIISGAQLNHIHWRW